MKLIRKIFYSLFAVCAFSSCIRGDSGVDCRPDVYLRFRYTYNINQSDAFANEVEHVSVWVFDSDGIFISRYTDNGPVTDGYALHVGSLPPGDYTFVAWCSSTKHDDEHSGFDYAEMIPGVSTITELTAHLPLTEDSRYDKQLNGTLNGMASANIGRGKQTVMIDMIKCTNTLRIILMPYRADQQLDSDNFLFRVNGRNALLRYDASIYREETVVYSPYYKATLHDRAAALTDAISVNNVIMTEMSLSRLFRELAPRLVIKDARDDNVLMDIDLTWLLSLQAGNGYRPEWSEQEYLDRQDNYSVIFFVDGDVLMRNHIIVNGWNISLEDNELQ